MTKDWERTVTIHEMFNKQLMFSKFVTFGKLLIRTDGNFF